MTFSFRNRIRLQENKRLNVEAETYELTSDDDGARVILQSGRQGQLIKDMGELGLIGSGYVDFERAFAAGIKWRQILSNVLARSATGTNFGDQEPENLALQAVHPHLIATLNLDPTSHWYQDRIGLLVFETDPLARFAFLSFDAVGLQDFPGNAPALIAAAHERHSGEWNDELKLAYQLIHASLADSRNPEARFILAVTAIEALIPHRERVPEVVAVIDSLVSQLRGMSDIDAETRNVVLNLLNSDKFESVRSFGLRLTDRLTRDYGGMPPRNYFDHVYKNRSDLAHGNLRNIPRLSAHELTQGYLELLSFVLDILEAWTADYSGAMTDGTP